ncbi:unnamed protein product [Cunninghamella blakesleeana]
MGNKVSVNSSKSSSTSIKSSKSNNPKEPVRERNQSLTQVPKHLKKTKYLNKEQKHQLEKLQYEKSKENIGIALPYQPISDNNSNNKNNKDNNNEFDFTHQQLKHYFQKSNQEQNININNNNQYNYFQHHQQHPLEHQQRNDHLNTPHFQPYSDFSDHALNHHQQQQAFPDENIMDADQGIMTINETDGPKIAYEWFEGRPFQNQTGLFMPNDQRELDRLRVLNYILRWCFQGDIVAPVKNALLGGAHVLSIGCGPGIWLGHPIIDFALDYKYSHFTAIDIANLLPDEYIYNSANKNDSCIKATPYEQCFNFSPLHPSLSSNIPCSSFQQKYQEQEKRQQQKLKERNNNDDQLLLNNHSHISTNNKTHSSLEITSMTSNTTTTSSITSQTRSYTSISNVSSSSNNNDYIQNLPIFDNLDFFVMDVRKKKLPFADNSFHFVMQRLSTSAYSVDQWDFVIQELVRVTEPGGYLQFIEIDYNSQGLGPQGQAWQEKLCDIMKKTKGLDPYIAGNIDKLLERHGLTNVVKKQVSLPFGSWGLDIGILWQQNLEAFIAASAPAFAMALGVTPNECKEMWNGYKSELDHVKAFTNVYAVYAQVPL